MKIWPFVDNHHPVDEQASFSQIRASIQSTINLLNAHYYVQERDKCTFVDCPADAGVERFLITFPPRDDSNARRLIEVCYFAATGIVTLREFHHLTYALSSETGKISPNTLGNTPNCLGDATRQLLETLIFWYSKSQPSRFLTFDKPLKIGPDSYITQALRPGTTGKL